MQKQQEAIRSAVEEECQKRSAEASSTGDRLAQLALARTALQRPLPRFQQQQWQRWQQQRQAAVQAVRDLLETKAKLTSLVAQASAGSEGKHKELGPVGQAAIASRQQLAQRCEEQMTDAKSMHARVLAAAQAFAEEVQRAQGDVVAAGAQSAGAAPEQEANAREATEATEQVEQSLRALQASMAAALGDAGARPGDPMLLCLSAGLEGEQQRARLAAVQQALGELQAQAARAAGLAERSTAVRNHTLRLLLAEAEQRCELLQADMRSLGPAFEDARRMLQELSAVEAARMEYKTLEKRRRKAVRAHHMAQANAADPGSDDDEKDLDAEVSIAKAQLRVVRGDIASVRARLRRAATELPELRLAYPDLAPAADTVHASCLQCLLPSGCMYSTSLLFTAGRPRHFALRTRARHLRPGGGCGTVVLFDLHLSLARMSLSVATASYTTQAHSSGNHPVFKATEQGSTATWALKKYASVSGPEERKRFRREAHILASLSHAFIVPVAAVFVDEAEDACYLQMPWLPSNLASWLRGYATARAITVEKLQEMIYRILIALQFIHSRRIVHRDLKPANILLDNEDNPFLSDFDHSLDPSLQASTFTATVSGRTVVVGSHYVAPEVIAAPSLVHYHQNRHAMTIHPLYV